jgi:hypothetical protein
MGKKRKGPATGSRESGAKEGSSSSALAPTRHGAKSISDLGMTALNWLATELGVPVSMVIKVLEADPSLLESVGAMAMTRASSAPAEGATPPEASAAISTAGQQSAEVSTSDTSTIKGLLINIEDPRSRLFVPEFRPSACQIPGSQAVETQGMFTIELSKYDIRIYNSADQQITRIWGDPHVNENGGGDDWHFGNDSTFVLTDGTKICLDTKETSPGVWLVQGVDIMAGSDRYHFGTGDEDGLHKDAEAWDKEHADVAAGDKSAGMFALKPDGTWAMQGTDGHFYDVKDESWSAFLGSGDVNVDDAKRTDLNNMQQYSVLFDHLPDTVDAPRGGSWDSGPDQSSQFSAMKLEVPKQRPQYLKYPDSSIVSTPMGYVVEMKNTEVLIWDLQGKQITRIWGDPHVNEKNNGATWHFGGNSTFILPDGAKICCDTEPISSNFWVVVGVDVILGASRFSFKKGGEGAMSNDGREFDKANSDADNRDDAGIFALTPSGEWAVMGRDGHFYDITPESWAAYKQDPDVDLAKGKQVKLTVQQGFAAHADQFPDDWMMPAVGEVSVENKPVGPEERRQQMSELSKILPISHMKLINESQPGLFPALCEDHVLAKFIADMPIATLKLLLFHAPHLIVQNPHLRPPKDAIWPRVESVGGRAKRPDPWWT